MIIFFTHSVRRSQIFGFLLYKEDFRKKHLSGIDVSKYLCSLYDREGSNWVMREKY
jgi:hypothetical protein